MIHEAVNNLDDTATYKQIYDYINSHHDGVKKGTILAQINKCTVNQPSRINYPQNEKPRKAEREYDFLFSTKRGEVTLYNPKIHGNFEIIIHDGKPMIAKDGKIISPKLKKPSATKKESYFIFSTETQSGDDDKEGHPYEYNSNVPNYAKVHEGANIILQRMSGNEHFFVGQGVITNIKQGHDSGNQNIEEHIAEFDNYRAFNPPKLRTDEIYLLMQKFSGFNNLHQIFPISEKIHNKIMGIATTNLATSEEIVNYAKILKKKSQLILYGPPGTGKTYNAMLLAKHFVKDNSPDIQLTFKSAVIKILKEAKKPMYYTEISRKILDQDLVRTVGVTPERTIQAVIYKDIQRNGARSIFVKTSKGIYNLNPAVDDYEIQTGDMSPSENKHRFVRSVTFHQSYSYEDFIEGIRPKSVDSQIYYNLEDGLFKQVAEDARMDPSNNYVLLIDEINRGNISKIFGELITLIERDKRGSYALQLVYSKESFTVPENLFIIGTMNTADRSLIQIDAALRRRFAFVELMPKPKLLTKKIDGISLQILLTALNQRITKEGLREKQIGHSYFMKVASLEDLQFIFTHEVVPLLQDYFFDDYRKLEEILGSGFVDSENMVIKSDWQTDTHLFLEILKNSFQL